MSFNKENTKKWVQEGIEKETIDSAFIAGWNLVCPNHKIENLENSISFETNNRERVVRKFMELQEGEKNNIVGRNKSDSLTTSQIRIAFGEMRKIQMNTYIKNKTNFLLLKPKLAYAVKRHDKKGLNEFYKIFVWAYDSVDTNNNLNGPVHFNNFIQIIEAILAYHKFHGGKE